MNRRALLVAAAMLMAVGRSLAQVQHKPARIGVLSSTSPEARSMFWDRFRQGMTELGWVENRDVIYVYRYTRGDAARFDVLAAELVAERPDLIFAGSQSAALAAKRASSTLPVVFAFATDPVESGLVASLSRPGGNATGLSSLSVETSQKLVELLKEIQPRLKRIAVVAPASTLGKAQVKGGEDVAKKLGVFVHPIFYTIEGIEGTLDAVEKARADAVLFVVTPLISRKKVVERMATLRVPTVYSASDIVVAGGLLSYGAEIGENFRLAAGYADRILKGARPADLPVQQPQVFELVVNLKTARAQGITIPQSILLRATRVIE